MSRQLLILVLLLLLVTGAALWLQNSSVSDSPRIRPLNLVLVTGGSSPYWQAIASGARAAAKEFNAELEVLMPEHDEDIDAQTKLLFGVDAEKTDGIAVSPLDAEQQTRLINRLSQKSVVVTLDSDAPYSTRMSYVGASNLAAGKKCAQLVQEAIPEGGKILVLVANLTKFNTQERKQGFEEQIAKSNAGLENGPKYTIADFLVDDGNVEQCQRQLLEALEKHPDLACIAGMNSYHGPILVKLVDTNDALKDLKLVTFDDEAATLQGIADGKIYGTVAQDPYHYGFESVRILASYCNQPEHQLPVPGLQSTITISTQAVRKDNVDKYRQLLQELTTEPASQAL